MSKSSFKKIIKIAVLDFWEQKFRRDAAQLSFLKYFKPQYYSLNTPHRIWTSAGSNPYEVEKAIIQARMLSGRYRCEKLRRHWSQNTLGHCELEPCLTLGIVGSLEHMLVDCVGLAESRAGVLSLWKKTVQNQPHILNLLIRYTVTEPDKTIQLLLDPSVLPEVIRESQTYGIEVVNILFYLTRTYCSALHKAKFKLLGLS